MREELIKQVNFIRKGGATKRYHTIHTIGENTVAHHSFGVACLIWLLDPTAETRLIMAGLAHDLAEQVTGDISSPTKRRFPELAEMVQLMEDEILESQGMFFQLSKEEQRTLKLADCMDGMLYCIGEYELGNRTIIEVYNRYVSYVTAMQPIEREWEVFQAIRAIMMRHTDAIS